MAPIQLPAAAIALSNCVRNDTYTAARGFKVAIIIDIQSFKNQTRQDKTVLQNRIDDTFFNAMHEFNLLGLYFLFIFLIIDLVKTLCSETIIKKIKQLR